MNQLGSREEAEDALQSTFLNAHRALQRGVTPEAELPWLFKIAHNVCLTRRRSTRRRGRVESPSDFEAVQDVVPAPPREARDELIQLGDALAGMPDNQRRAILLREWKGLSYHEIAAELELSQPAVETLIFRARRTLAANLEAKPGLLARARQALDLGALVAAVKTLFEGAVAVKATAAAVAVSSAVVVAAAPNEPMRSAAVEKPRAKVAQVSSPRVVSEAKAPASVRAGTPRAARAVSSPRVAPVRAAAKRPAAQSPAAASPAVEAMQPAPAAEIAPSVAAPAPEADPPRPAAAEPAKQLRHQRPDRKERPVATPRRNQKPDPAPVGPQPEPVATDTKPTTDHGKGAAEPEQVQPTVEGTAGLGG